jgi:glycosyltransferase involved in cell wall biosynthesis
MKRRLLFFSHYFPPEGNAPASRTHETLRRWVREGRSATVVTCAPNVPRGVVYPGYTNRLRQDETIDGVRVVRVWTYLAPNEGILRRSLNYVSYLLTAVPASLGEPRPDVVIATSPQFFCGWAGLVAAALRRVPFVLEVRDLWPDTILAVGAIGNRLVVRALYALERWLYTGADLVVTVGDGYREELVKKGVPPEKIVVVPNGVDLDRFAPRPCDAELVLRHGLEGRFVVSVLGTIGMASGLDVVLGAAELLRAGGEEDVTFLLIGDGALREALEARARERGLDRVVFLGRRDKAEIPRWLSVTDACLVHLRDAPLFRTVMPSKIFEAAAMARPIVIGVPGHATDLVLRARCGIAIPPEDPRALVTAIRRLRDDPAGARRLGENGRDWVSRHHDRDRLALDYLAAIDRVPNRPA